MSDFKVGDKVRVNARGHLFGTALQEYGTHECVPGDTGVVTKSAGSVTGNLLVRWDKNGNTSAIRPESLEGAEKAESEPTQIWGEHLADIGRAMKILSDTTKALNEPAADGQPGHWSDLEFDFPKRVPINLDGKPTGWALEFIEDWDDWGLVIDRADA